MVKLIMGLPGSGKTKTLISLVNEAAQNEAGSVVCIERSKNLTYDISRQVRLVSADEFGINSNELLQGFLTGLHAGNYDITKVFIDGFFKILNDRSDAAVEKFLNWLDAYSTREGIDFTISVSADPAAASEGIRKFI